MSSTASAPLPRLTFVQWLVCVMAAIGFAFDIYELLMLPLIVKPALLELTGAAPGSDDYLMWVGRLFYVPAFAGGLFGLFGGYLTDRLGRRRVLTWSILLYAVSAFLAGFSTSIEMLLILRCTTFIGVCVEFVAAVAWLAELFPQPQRRERVLGYTQAFSSVGGLLVAAANALAIKYAMSLPAISLPEWISLPGDGIANPHAAWRYTLMSGLIPALPLLIIRPFLPESPAWREKKLAGTLKRPSIRELFSPALARTTIITTIMFACSYGAAFGAIQHVPRIVPGLAETKEHVAGLAVPEQKRLEEGIANEYVHFQEVGGLVGRFLLAMLAVQIVSRRWLLRVFQWPGLFLVPLVFYGFAIGYNRELFRLPFSFPWSLEGGGPMNVHMLHMGMFVAGLFTVAQFSFWGNYLPRVYPVHLRGTGESFAANIGGRMIGTSFALVTTTLEASNWIPLERGPIKLAYVAAGVALFVYLLGSICSFLLPEPPHEDLPE